MAGPAIEYRDKNSIIEGYRLHESPYWSIWQGNTLKWCCDKEDEGESETLLIECLDALEASGTNAVYTVRIHSDAKNFNNKKVYKGSFSFRLNDPQQMQPYNSMQGTNPNIVVVRQPGTPAPAQPTGLEAVLAQMAETNRLILEKLSEEPEEEPEEEEPEEDPQEKLQRTIGMIGGMLEQYQPVLLTLIDRIFPRRNDNNTSPSNIGNMVNNAPTGDINERLEAAQIKIINIVGPEKFVEALEKLGQMSPEKLKGLLMML